MAAVLHAPQALLRPHEGSRLPQSRSTPTAPTPLAARHLSARRRVSRQQHVCRYATDTANEFAVDQSEEEDFYAILGVAPTASERDIKVAYKNQMKLCHPDLNTGIEAEDSTDICVCLNYIMDVLLDPERRAAYDAIAGFSLEGVNPMRDPAAERDHLFVDEITCIGCYQCANCCPRTFQMEADFGRARVGRQGMEDPEKQQEAVESCPVDAIHWTSAAQLTLLETVMQQLERVDVFLLFMGGGKSVDVFQEAELAWDKRQAKLRFARKVADAEMRSASRPSGLWDTSPAAGAKTWEERQRAAGVRPEAEKQRATARAAAQAARRWRDYQRSKRKEGVSLLADAITLEK